MSSYNPVMALELLLSPSIIPWHQKEGEADSVNGPEGGWAGQNTY